MQETNRVYIVKDLDTNTYRVEVLNVKDAMENITIDSKTSPKDKVLGMVYDTIEVEE